MTAIEKIINQVAAPHKQYALMNTCAELKKLPMKVSQSQAGGEFPSLPGVLKFPNIFKKSCALRFRKVPNVFIKRSGIRKAHLFRAFFELFLKMPEGFFGI